MEQARELLITARRRTVANERALLSDFDVTPGGTVNAQWLIQNPQISLYCLDAATSQAIFVELPPDLDLAAAPFVWNAHYEGAQRLFSLPYSHLLELSEQIETKLDRLILLFNIGRCGSTLLHQIFNQVPSVVSLSEADGFIPFLNEDTRLPEREAIALLQASAKFLFRPQLFPHLAVPVIKFRGRDLRLLNLCHVAFPTATLLFLYRDALSWSASWMRVEQQLEQGVRPGLKAGTSSDKEPLDKILAWFRSVFAAIDLDELGLGALTGTISPAQRLALTWLLVMDYCQRRAQEGLPVTALRYVDLNRHRQETLSKLFAACNLPLDAVQLAISGFERDSQQGTVMAREEKGQGNPTRLSEQQEKEIRSFISHHPVIQTPDFVAANTIPIA